MSLMDKLNAATGGDVDNWIPDDVGKGAVIEGRIVALTEQESDFQTGVMIPFITLETRDGKILLRGYDTIFRNEFAKTGAKIGWNLAVRYDGQTAKKKGKFAGKMMRAFTMVAEEPSLAGKLPAADADADVPF